MAKRFSTRKRRGKTFRVILCEEVPAPGIGIDINIDDRTLHCWRGMKVDELINSFQLIREKAPDFRLALPTTVDEPEGDRP